MEGGYDCELVDKPPSAVQHECPVCLLVLREPYQVSCCGYGFCKACIEIIKDSSKPCLCCKTENFDHFHDKRLKRSLSDLKVCCIKGSEGCDWVGELGDLDEHLNSDPLQEKQLKGCKFVKIQCLHCSSLIKRSDILAHQANCPKRPFSCEYCEVYESYYEDVITNHWPLCSHYPVKCPNKCGKTLQRQYIDNHVAKSCPLTIINCDFSYVGCDKMLARKDMSAHLNGSTVTHLFMQVAHYKKNVLKLEGENCQLREQMMEYQQMLLGCEEKLKRLEEELKPKVEGLVKDLQALLQPKKKEAKRRWKVEKVIVSQICTMIQH